MSEKTLTVIFAESYNIWIARLKGNYAAHEKATEKSMEAVADHARNTDPVKKELLEALKDLHTRMDIAMGDSDLPDDDSDDMKAMQRASKALAALDHPTTPPKTEGEA